MLCEPSGYVYNMELYSGKTEPIPGYGRAKSIVLSLVESLLDEGRELYVDSCYTSYALAVELLRRQSTIVGTLRESRLVLVGRFLTYCYEH